MRWAAVLALATGCTRPAVTADQVTSELVEAGCLAPGSSAAVLAELELDGAAQDPTLRRAIACLFDGGTVASCDVGCVARPAAR